MLHWTWRTLASEPGAFLASAAGIALALLLSLYLDAVFRGEAQQIVALVEHARGDLWVLQDGVEDLHMASTRLTENEVAAVAAVPGVGGVIRLVYRPALYGRAGQERVAYVLGVPAGPAARDVLVGAPVAPEAGTAVIPEAMGRKEGLRLGDAIRIRHRDFRVSGFSRGTFSMANPLIYVTEQDARALFEISDGAHALLVTVAAGADAGEVRRRVNEASDYVTALTKAELVANDYRLALDMGGALVGILGMIGAAVAGLIVAFTAYSSAARHAHELAVVKALGATPRQLGVSMMFQTGLLGLSGGLLAALAMWGLDVVLDTLVPEVAVQPAGSAMAWSIGAALAVAELAAMVPAIIIHRTDPALAFRA